jgi:hypothetical protein
MASRSNSIDIAILSVSGRWYTLEYADNLISRNWTNHASQTLVEGTGEQLILRDTATGKVFRTYRVKITAP